MLSRSDSKIFVLQSGRSLWVGYLILIILVSTLASLFLPATGELVAFVLTEESFTLEHILNLVCFFIILFQTIAGIAATLSSLLDFIPRNLILWYREESLNHQLNAIVNTRYRSVNVNSSPRQPGKQNAKP